jgi:hypothetical protein
LFSKHPCPPISSAKLVAVRHGGIYFAFQAKLNPIIDDPTPLHAPEIEQTFKAAEAADYLDKVSDAIRERRLFGFLVQQQAESAVGAGEWIARPVEEVIAEAARDANTRINLPNIQKSWSDEKISSRPFR